MHSKGKVPHFTLRPNPVVTIVFFLALIIGGLVALSFNSMDEGAGQYRQRAIFTLFITGTFCIGLVIIATSKLWFSHLWKKNSTHARHKQHTHHHPSKRHKSRRHH